MTDKFINKAKLKHGERYDYSETKYLGCYEKVEIVCRKHGSFWQQANNHLQGKGCKSCGIEARASKRRLGAEAFKQKAIEKHGKQYDYSLVRYKNNTTPIKLICKIHGIFMQAAAVHLTGCGCPKCGVEKNASSQRFDTDIFIKKSLEMHGSRFSYDNAVYISWDKKVRITCSKHGDFLQTPSHHLNGQGCPQCANETRNKHAIERCRNGFSNKAKLKHGDRYDYSKVEYINATKPIMIICPKHGIFEQLPSHHVSGCGCPECGIKKLATSHRDSSASSFVERSNVIHGGIYGYDKVKYTGCRDKVDIICQKHGVFKQTPDGHLQGKGCPRCWHGISKGEDEMAHFIQSLGVVVERSNRCIISPKEIDIICPDQRLGIEYSGAIWHSSKYKTDRYYHLAKLDKMNGAGYRLIQFWDSEWIAKGGIVKSIIRNAVGATTHRIMARKCVVKEVALADFQLFADNNHLQGRCRATKRWGLYFDGELVSCIAIVESAKKNEMVRFVTKLDTVVAGGLSRLVKAYGKPLVTYCERRLFEGRGYEAAGFVKGAVNDTDLSFVNSGGTILNRRNFQKKNQEKRWKVDWNMSEKANAEANGWYQLFGCGTVKYTFNKK